MADNYINSKQILNAISPDDDHKRGKLKIFFGYAAGVGKTYAMLEAAHDALKNNIDVVAGYIEPHTRPDTLALLEGLESIPAKVMRVNGFEYKEFDIDKALERKPELILVDEYAHTNAKGSRHDKRYQDIEELLSNGINVYTSVNVQHIESLNDIVGTITKVTVREKIPDSAFDKADQIEIIDIEPRELLERLQQGKIYKREQAKRALNNFFTLENLTALREIALRRCADHVNAISVKSKIKQHDYYTEEHVLVGLSSSPSNAKIIRTAARMATAFNANFTALFVETSDFSSMSKENADRLRKHIHLAEQLGAQIETVCGNDVPFQIAEFARLSGASKIVIGRSAVVKSKIFPKTSLVEKLISYAPQLDVYVIPDSNNSKPYRVAKAKANNEYIITDLLITLAFVTISSLIGIVFKHMGFNEANIIMVYVLGCLVASIQIHNRISTALISILSVLAFNFFFTVPYFSLKAYGAGYPFTFFFMFLSSFLTSTLALKLKNHAKQSALVAYRTRILLEANQSLQQAKTSEEIFDVTAKQIIELTKKDVVVYNNDNGKLSKPSVYYADDNKQNNYIDENEKAVALWVFKNNKHAGATTKTLSNAKCLYLAIRINQNIFGVIGIAINDIPLDSFQKSVLLSILGECAITLQNEKNAREKEEVAVMAKNEKLKANLLRAISHDLRTPLTSISGNASNFLANEDSLDEETKRQLFTDIYDDSMWLINLVENLLSVTRLEENRLNLNLNTELVDDVINEALKHTSRKRDEHHISVSYEDEFLLAKIDARLIVQVIINIVDNAIKYTPVGSNINLHAYKENDEVYIEISDDGPGINDEDKEKIFDMFYSGANKVIDSRRSLGLGLSLCKTIINAHGGKITVSDNKPKGTVFTFSLPLGEANIHE